MMSNQHPHFEEYRSRLVCGQLCESASSNSVFFPKSQYTGADNSISSPRSSNTDLSLPMQSKNTSENLGQGSNELKTIQEESTTEVAMLLTSVADIASKEIKADPPIVSSLKLAFPCFPDLSRALSETCDTDANQIGRAKYDMDYIVERKSEDQERAVSCEISSSPTLLHFDHTKTRAVSLDSHEPKELDGSSYERRTDENHPYEDEVIPALLQWRTRSVSESRTNSHSSHSPPHQGIFSTPPPSPRVTKQTAAPNSDYRRSEYTAGCMFGGGGDHVLKSIAENVKTGRPRAVSLAEISGGNRCKTSHRYYCAKNIHSPFLVGSESSESDSTRHQEKGGGTPMKLILRKKFSWKNYPELEEFLIANREEYLRHSTLNYTMQQKEYNNRLTERMIQLAADHGYTFDEQDFSFVTVRDRIRCYFKSYVQSMKKRGVVIGYAARKAGLVSEKELEKSAQTSGKIYIPRS